MYFCERRLCWRMNLSWHKVLVSRMSSLYENHAMSCIMRQQIFNKHIWFSERFELLIFFYLKFSGSTLNWPSVPMQAAVRKKREISIEYIKRKFSRAWMQETAIERRGSRVSRVKEGCEDFRKSHTFPLRFFLHLPSHWYMPCRAVKAACKQYMSCLWIIHAPEDFARVHARCI